ncbi:hypothetical protein IWX49DRAFT_23806 [Phyllosticta citricarpa]
MKGAALRMSRILFVFGRGLFSFSVLSSPSFTESSYSGSRTLDPTSSRRRHGGSHKLPSCHPLVWSSGMSSPFQLPGWLRSPLQTNGIVSSSSSSSSSASRLLAVGLPHTCAYSVCSRNVIHYSHCLSSPAKPAPCSLLSQQTSHVAPPPGAPRQALQPLLQYRTCSPTCLPACLPACFACTRIITSSSSPHHLTTPTACASIALGWRDAI